MNRVRRILLSLALLAVTNAVLLFLTLGGCLPAAAVCLILLAAFVYINLRPIPKTAPTKRIHQLSAGCELLRLFLISATVNVVWMLALLPSVIRDPTAAAFSPAFGWWSGCSMPFLSFSWKPSYSGTA